MVVQHAHQGCDIGTRRQIVGQEAAAGHLGAGRQALGFGKNGSAFVSTNRPRR
jgi:hypothetical protein